MRRLLPLVLLPMLGACGTTTVFDDWTCDAPTGRCSTVADVDAEATGQETLTPTPLSPRTSPPLARPAEGDPAPTSPSANSSQAPDGLAPLRTPDVVARIVFAPFTDGSGVFHGRAVVHAVMKDGEWIAPEEPQTNKEAP